MSAKNDAHGNSSPEKKALAKGSVVDKAIRSRRKRLSQIEDIKSFISRLLVMIVMIYIMFFVIFGLQPMANDDMKPRISAGDLMLYYRLETRINSDDVVVFQKEGKTYTGRIVAKGGDKVEVTDDSALKINDSTMIESDIFYATPKYDDYVEYPLTLANDEYFILCDYRNGAKDSRYFGAVKKSEIKGKVITIIRRSNL
ncbi:signal peptidase I [Oribacterium sp. WCC10]|uniref:signal peptidase I n=1 Tax=Oribacterium sp. WCC10 TaxID=1855343 RepID=UPI0008E48DBA|nr:signal peptidase I [Oribacterium sp. WCC10]SFG07977.1 signal peptidase I [Oribacterium sp. WCC10]